MPTIYGTDDRDIIHGTAEDDVIHANGEGDTIYGNGGNDTIYPGAGVDTAYGGAGDDRIVLADYDSPPYFIPGFYPEEQFHGGDGFDTLELRTFSGQGSETAWGPTSPHYLFYMGISGIERFKFVSSQTQAILATINLNQLPQEVVGGVGQDILLISGTFTPGDYTVPAIALTNWQSTDVIGFSTAGGTLRAREGLPGTQRLSASEQNDFLYGSSGIDQLFGGGGDDYLVAGAGDDYLNGGPGADTMDGGLGNDTDDLADQADTIIESVDQGDDTAIVSSEGTFLLAAGVSIETLRTNNPLWTGSLTVSGNEFGQSIYGNAGANVLNGFGGVDYLVGIGGNDTLDGGEGADYLQGGTGNDLYRVDNAGDVVLEVAGEGDDRSRPASATLWRAALTSKRSRRPGEWARMPSILSATKLAKASTAMTATTF